MKEKDITIKSGYIRGYIGLILNNTDEDILINHFSEEILFQIKKIIDSSETVSFLFDMFVNEEDRGQGLGKYLVNQYCDECQAAGAKFVVLQLDSFESQKNNFNLESFYLGLGFVALPLGQNLMIKCFND